MAASVDTPSPTNLNKESTSFMGSSPSHTPSSDKRLWSALRSRIDLILESRNCRVLTAQNQLTLDTSLPTTQMNVRRSERVKGLKEDSMLLLKGFDSIAHTLSQLSNNLDSALQGARDLAKPPTLTEIFNSNLRDEESREESEKKQQNKEGTKKGTKRKFAPSDDSVYQGDDFQKENEEIFKDNNNKNMKKAKNLAVSMATKATSLARELKSIKSDLCFMQDRCTLLEEENRRLRDGFAKGIRPEEDDLVRLQLEALLSEKSRLANENANLTRENQCLHQLVEYHQITSQDLSTSYEQVIQGMCLDFSSPMPSTEEDANKDEDANTW